MKGFIYWFFGPSFGRVVYSNLAWFFGLQIDQGGAVATEVGRQSIQDMMDMLQRFQQAVAEQKGALMTIKRSYAELAAQYQSVTQQAETAAQRGMENEARLAIKRQLMLEKGLAQAEQQVQLAEEKVRRAEEAYRLKQDEVEQFKFEQESLEMQNAINQALSQMTQLNSVQGMEEAETQFRRAQSAVRQRGDKLNALSELQDTASTSASLDRLSADDAVEQRLRTLKSGRASQSLPPDGN